MRVVSVMSIVSLVRETKQGTGLRMHSPSAATKKTTQRAREISKLFAVRARRENRDSTMLYGLSASTTADTKRPRSYVSRLFARQC